MLCIDDIPQQVADDIQGLRLYFNKFGQLTNQFDPEHHIYGDTMGTPNKPNDFNWGMDAYAAERFFTLCPTPVYISAEGSEIVTGEHLSTRLNSDHPLRQAYELWLGKKAAEDQAGI